MSAKLDALVAERVLKWTLADREALGWGKGLPVWMTSKDDCPTWQGFSPSKDIEDAWQVVEKMAGHWFGISYQHAADEGMEHERCGVRVYKVGDCEMPAASSFAATLPLAICLAALRACGVDEATIEGAMK